MEVLMVGDCNGNLESQYFSQVTIQDKKSLGVLRPSAMMSKMTADALFSRLRRRPFVPFRLILTSGTTYDVLHPEMLFITKSGLTVAIYDREQHPSPDEIPMRESLISFLHVAATEDLPQPTSKAG
jgi:hypothetical protein